MKPFTLEWWIKMQGEAIREAILLVYTGDIYCARYSDLREIVNWMNNRIITKYGERDD